MSKEIEIKDAKCRGLSLQVPVVFAAEKKTGDDADFVMEAYTGQVVNRWWGKLAIDVAGITAKKSIPIFRDHERGHIVGYSSDTWKDGSFFVSGKFSQATAHAAEVQALAKEGFPWQASIGVMPVKILALEDKAAYQVNGKTLKGPAEVWLESEVFETSFVPLGADGNTSVSVFARFDEAEQPGDDPKEERTMQMGDNNLEPVVLTIEILKADHKDLVAQLLAEGATAERARIMAVLENSMPGHEDLVTKLAFDGKTTGPEAAVQLLAAEKAIRKTAAQNLRDDAPAPVAAPPAVDMVDIKNLPAAERCKLAWDKDPDLRAEYRNNFDAYKAFEEAQEKGRIKILGKK
jgi:hypothetical protein